MIQDTVLAVVSAPDSLQVVADSLVTTVGTQVGVQVSALLALVLGVVTKFLVDGARKVLAALDTAPAPVKALVATGFAQVAMWITVKTGLIVNPDVTALETTIAGLTVALSAMGVHALSKLPSKK